MPNEIKGVGKELEAPLKCRNFLMGVMLQFLGNDDAFIHGLVIVNVHMAEHDEAKDYCSQGVIHS